MDLHLTGKTAVVTGGSRGIGLAIAQGLADEGVRVVCGARTPADLPEGSGILTLEVDLSTPEGPQQLADYALEHLGGIDVLVNNVGGGLIPDRPFPEIDDKFWYDALKVTFLSTVRATRAMLPGLLKRRGSIIHIGSIAAHTPDPGHMPYSAAKSAALNFTAGLAKQYAGQGLRVNTIAPGVVNTGLWRSARRGRGAAGERSGHSTGGRHQGNTEAGRNSHRTGHGTGGDRRARAAARLRSGAQHHRRGIRCGRRPDVRSHMTDG